ncbi:ribosome maturation factor RimP [Kineosporia sp. R_H_3]|uniref:ribosome maturation factor RimP n=1 Tax=Kineosporia sp. R_H_3 TaxID=1961848 RepID=UPI000B4A5713|nr:ribosome maturation factor RimP [Kineosporia sp. R_H_3]
MGTTTPDQVRAVAAAAVTSAGLVLEDVTVTPAGRRRVLRVVVDLPDDVLGGVPVESVESAARAVSEALDSSDVMGATPYVLEVTSPGVDRPLTERRHWLRARGRLVTVTLADGGTVAGRLTEAGDDGVTVDGRPLGWDDLRKGRVEVEFNRPDEPAGADDDLVDDETDDTDDTDDEDGEEA